MRPFQHPEINKPKPPRRKSKGEKEIEKDKAQVRSKEFRKMRESGVRPDKARLPRKLR